MTKMHPEDYFGVDIPVKQSAGYMFLRLLTVQVAFMLFNVALLFEKFTTPMNISFSIFNLSTADIELMLIGIVVNFIVFLLVFAQWRSVEYRISSSHLHVTRGLMMLNSELTISFKDIDHFHTYMNIAGRLLGYGTVDIYLKSQGKHIQLRGVSHAHLFATYLEAEMRVCQQKSREA